MQNKMTILCMVAAACAILPAAAAERVTARDGVSYVSGGVGVDSQERLNARAAEFNLKLVFTLNEGNYLADVDVTVADSSGQKLVEHVADGPFFMARLPAGSYRVTAVYEGKAQTRGIKVGGGLRTEYFRWPSDPVNDFAGVR